MFGTATTAIDNFVASLLPLVTAVLAAEERDDARLLVRPEADQVDLVGNIVLSERRRWEAGRLVHKTRSIKGRYERRGPRDDLLSPDGLWRWRTALITGRGSLRNV